MNRLQKVLAETGSRGSKLLSVYVAAGFPDAESTPEIVTALAEAGTDLIELGIPFSDPVADGPTIQTASQVALQNGMTVARVLDLAAMIRQRCALPLILMGYLNPLLRYGLETFVRDAIQAGADGLIVPDLPPEESARLLPVAQTLGLSMIFLAAPNSSDTRLQTIDEMTDSFVYCVSVTGVTGARAQVSADTVAFLRRCRQLLRHPFLVGFGISGAEQAQKYRDLAAGVIVGSAVIDRLGGEAPLDQRIDEAAQLVKEIKAALIPPPAGATRSVGLAAASERKE